MGSLISGLFKAAWWIIATFCGSIIWAFTAPFTIMMLDDSAQSLKDWYN